MSQIRENQQGASAAQARPAPGVRETPSVARLRGQWRGQVRAGQVIDAVLRSHTDYVEVPIHQLARAADRLDSLGPAREVGEHLDLVRSRWDAARAPTLSGRHVVLGLALDPDVGWQLLQDGVIGSLLSRWRPGLGTAEEPHRLVWDVLSESGLELAEQQPLLATGFGAPAEASITLPAPVRAMAWSPGGDRLAVLAGDTVYEARPETGSAHAIGEFGQTVESIGWGGQGVVGLSIEGGVAELLRASGGASLGDRGGVSAGVLSGDGSHAWSQASDGVYRWAPSDTSPARMTSPGYSEPATPVAVDRTGYHGLLRLPKNNVLVVSLPPGSLPGPEVGRDPYWPRDAAPMIGWGPPRSSRCALVTMGRRVATAYAGPDGVDVWHLRGVGQARSEGPNAPTLPFVPICRIATGANEAGALAADATGTVLAVGIGTEVAVWSLGRRRSSSVAVPAYDTDRPDQSDDLLGADQDARAIAALVSAGDVRPPLSIGLFGAWGSGKSFLMQQVVRLLAATDRPEGYLRHIRVVQFNAWQYAEANLWASLVDQVLQVITPVRPPESPPEVTEATSRAEEASKAANNAATEVEHAQRRLEEARAKLVTQRHRAAWLGAVVLVLVAAAIVAAVLGGTGRVIAAVSAALALISAAAGVLDRARTATEQAGDLADAGRSGIATLGRFLGRPEELAVQARAAELRRLEEQHAHASAEAERLTAARDRVTDLALEQPLGALLHRLATINEYRDQLSLVTRTRDHFSQVDEAIRAARTRAASAARTRVASAEPWTAPAAGSSPAPPELERVVIVIDDLDRCPPEKVVSVLEAVHLLFSFEMFAVIIAVDTRWLEQSLRIRYRRLLGGSAAAAPTDYLEKIIQVPLHLLPMDDSMVRAMIAGLTRTTSEAGSGERRDAVDQPSGGTPVPEASARGDGPLTATVPRLVPKVLTAEVLRVTARETAAMSLVAPLVGATPRSVKRFVNTYRLIKARSTDPESFDQAGRGAAGDLGDHEVVAFLLAVVIGRPSAAGPVLSGLVGAPPGATVEQVLSGLPPAGTPPERASGLARSSRVSAELAVVLAWVTAHRSYADAPAQRCAVWARQVGRFSFTPPGGENGGYS